MIHSLWMGSKWQWKGTGASHGYFHLLIQERKNRKWQGPATQLTNSWPQLAHISRTWANIFSTSAYLETSTGAVEMAFSCFRALLGCGDKQSECFHVVLVFVGGKTEHLFSSLKKLINFII